ncbi:Zn-dependent alcohol dehydrogenase [Nocardioides sambongensis]|uniref:Zn-dependent alcohol dehydrogenase n=1 Tax=Nocardioides sambongensis TaxID=2589074 RepID=UPI001E4AB29D|nr:Zn-dependent alcohol dehydrogenase [Nocardioides sambongensis]
MRTPIRAAVLNSCGRLDYETVHIDLPGPDEVRIRPLHVGLCHSDLHYIDGTHQTNLPEILGHEAAGVVESVGSAVASVKVGDRVVTSLTMFCGSCRYCVTGRMALCSNRTQLRDRPQPAVVTDAGQAVGTMGGIGAFAGLLLVHQNGVVRVADDLPLPVASLFGCAVLTGVGAVVRSARVATGDTVAVIGCGGIGLSAVQGARIAGASRIVAVDLSATKLEAARSMGATDTLESGPDVVRELNDLLGAGVDHVFEAVGRRETVELGLQMLSPGGRCTVLGMVPDDTPIRVSASDLYFLEKTLTGAFIGSSRFTVDIPQLAALYQQGRLQLDEMISHRVPFEELSTGFDRLADGSALRVVADMPLGP